MGKGSDAPELKVGSLAANMTPNNLAGSMEEAQEKSPKLDPTPNDLRVVNPDDRPNEEVAAAVGSVVTDEKSRPDGEEEANGKYRIPNSSSHK